MNRQSELRTTIKFTPANWKRMAERNVRASKIHDHGFTAPSTRTERLSYFISVRLTSDGLLDPVCNCKAGQAKVGCVHALAVVHEFNRDTRHLAALMPERRRAA